MVRPRTHVTRVIVNLGNTPFDMRYPMPPTTFGTYDLVVLDLDGTLYDKRCLSLRMLLHAPCDFRRMLIERQTRASMKGMYMGSEQAFCEAFFQRMADTLHCSQKSIQQWYEQRYMPLMVNLIGRYQPVGKWVLPYIEQCKAKGIKTVVLSDYGHAKEKLQALGLCPTLFDWVVSAPELGGLKPAPELLLRLAELMGVAAGQCLVIGDRDDTDGELARKTGAKFHKVTY